MTNNKPRILGISGSLRRESFSGAVLRALQEAAGELAAIEIFPLASVPLYNADLDGEQKPEPVVALKAAIRDCDGLILVSPEYNYGIPGVLKNAIDWASRPGYHSVLKDKPVLLMASSIGAVGGARAYAQLRQTLSSTLSRIVAMPDVLIGQVQAKVQDGRLTDATTLKYMLDALNVLLGEIRKRHRSEA
jgi:chromate reductase